MTVSKIFATQPAGPVPASYIDLDFSEVVNLAAINVTSFGVVGNGITDDTTNFQTALDSFGAPGGTLRIPATCRCLVGNLTIPANVRLLGDLGGPDADTGNTSVNFEDLGSALYTTAGTTITLEAGATVERVLLSPSAIKGAQQADTSAFAGTCFTSTGEGYGCAIIGCAILGYAKAALTNALSRFRFEWNAVDCNAVLDMTGSFDTTRILNNQCWPYLTIVAYSGSSDPTLLERSGTGFDLKTGTEDTVIDGNLLLGFLVGIKLTNASDVNLGNNWIDHPAGQNRSGNIGIQFGTGCTHIVALQLYIFSCKEGVVFDMGVGGSVGLANLFTGQTDSNAVRHESGHVYIGYHSADTIGGAAVKVNNTTYNCQINSYCYFSITAASPIDCGVANISPITLRVGRGTWDGAVGSVLIGGTNALAYGTIASAATLNLPQSALAAAVSGTTGITAIGGGWAGREITLYFLDVLTITHNSTSLVLAGGVDYTTFAGSTITLQSSGGNNWVEVSRQKRDGTPVYSNKPATWTAAQGYTSYITTMNGTAVGAGANTQAFIKASTASDLGIYYGTGAPSFSAAQGSIYSNVSASTSTTRVYVNTTGSTTWASFTASA